TQQDRADDDLLATRGERKLVRDEQDSPGNDPDVVAEQHAAERRDRGGDINEAALVRSDGHAHPAAPSRCPAATRTWKSDPSQRSASGQKNVNTTCSPSANAATAKSAIWIPSPTSRVGVSWIVRQASPLQCTTAGASVSTRRLIPAGTERIR